MIFPENVVSANMYPARRSITAEAYTVLIVHFGTAVGTTRCGTNSRGSDGRGGEGAKLDTVFTTPSGDVGQSSIFRGVI